jgi:hypothetical protein
MEANLDAVMDRLDTRVDNTLRGNSNHSSPFRVVVPVRVHRDSEISVNAEMSGVPLGVAIDPRSDKILKMGGVCKDHYGLQIFFFT